jgi:hypothetical protein
MGLTDIRYIDLKNYLDAILGAEVMRDRFEQVRVDGTDFLYHPLDVQKQNRYLYSTSLWAEEGIANLPVPVDNYPGYLFSFSVYDASGCLIYGSNFPTLTILSEAGGVYTRNTVPLTPTMNPQGATSLELYKMCNNYILLPFLDVADSLAQTVMNSDFVINQMALPESIMAVASLLVDSANTRTFGVPRYGFSDRSNQLQQGGISYHCAQIIEIRTMPNENGETTLIESVFARLTLAEYTSPLMAMGKPLWLLSRAPPGETEEEDLPPPPPVSSLPRSLRCQWLDLWEEQKQQS